MITWMSGIFCLCFIKYNTNWIWFRMIPQLYDEMLIYGSHETLLSASLIDNHLTVKIMSFWETNIFIYFYLLFVWEKNIYIWKMQLDGILIKFRARGKKTAHVACECSPNLGSVLVFPYARWFRLLVWQYYLLWYYYHLL